MHPKAQKLRHDAKAIWTALKAIIEAAPNGILSEAQQTEIGAKRNEADAMIKSAEAIDAVESGLSALDKPISHKAIDADALAIDDNAESTGSVISESVANRIHKVGCSRIPKAIAHKAGLYMAHVAQAARIPGLSIDARTRQLCHDAFGDISAAQIEGSNIAGGNLVFPEFDTTIINLRELFGTFRRNTKMVTMARETKNLLRRTGGLSMYLVGESSKIKTSNKTWDRIALIAKKCGALTISSIELDEDSAIDLGADLMSELAYSAALGEDLAGWNGDGTTGGATEYLGMFGVRYKLKNLSGTISKIYGLTVGSGSGHTTDYTQLVLTDFQAVVASLPAYADTPNCKWYVHRSFYYNVMVKLAQAAGGTQMPQILDGTGVRRFMFMGYPVEFVQAFPKTAAASQVCALFGDLELASKMGERKGLEFAASQDANIVDGSTTYPLWQNYMMAWRMIERIDINVHDVGTNSDIVATPTVDIPGAGPIVGLITAAS